RLQHCPPPSRTRTNRLDRATVFDQREHITLHLVGELSRLGKAGPLEEATAIAVLALDLDGQVFQALSRELRQPCVEQQHPYATPRSVRQYVNSREPNRLGRPAHELCESDDIATRFGDEETRSPSLERATQSLR